VALVDMVLKAYMFDVWKQLSVFIGLIITNCIVMGRLEAFAMGNKPWDSVLDGLGSGFGYAWVILAIAFFRELFGSGKLFGFEIIPQAAYDFGYINNGLMVTPVGAFIILGIIIWVQRSRNGYVEEH
jgi:Na+-transporting NADH:ubiquinone oxidoreductase subunit D